MITFWLLRFLKLSSSLHLKLILWHWHKFKLNMKKALKLFIIKSRYLLCTYTKYTSLSLPCCGIKRQTENKNKFIFFVLEVGNNFSFSFILVRIQGSFFIHKKTFCSIIYEWSVHLFDLYCLWSRLIAFALCTRSVSKTRENLSKSLKLLKRVFKNIFII